MRLTIYGIKNCDTMKKARAWLDAHGVNYDFHDYKAAGIDRAHLEAWAAKVGWEVLLTPITYLVVGFLKRREGIDVYDRGTDFSPFKTSV